MAVLKCTCTHCVTCLMARLAVMMSQMLLAGMHPAVLVLLLVKLLQPAVMHREGK